MERFEEIKKEQRFMSRIPAYTPLSILIRGAVTSLVGIIIVKFVVHASDIDVAELGKPRIWDYLKVMFVFNLMGEAIIVMDNIFEYFLPVPSKLRKRLAIQPFFNIALIFLIYKFTIAISPDYHQIEKSVFYMSIAFGLVFVTFFSSTLLISRFTEKWIHAEQSMDELKREKLKMDYNTLQDQLNPHFLFNNLSVLKSLIIYDKDTAVTFTENFTDVYRYVLQSKDKMLVEFGKEQEFINSYIGLHKERLGEGLEVKFLIDKDALNKEIAPLTLQLLVENAIKHNITSKEKPLEINISADSNYLTVENSLQLRESSYSTQTGLSNLIKRYHMISDNDIEISEDADKFKVKVPLL